MKVLKNTNPENRKERRTKKRNQDKAIKNVLGKMAVIPSGVKDEWSMEDDTITKMTCVMTLTEEDIESALAQQKLRVHGILYEVPVNQLEYLRKTKQFGLVKLTLTKSKSQIPPSAPGTINVQAENKKDLVKWLKENKPSQNEPGKPLLKVVREDCGCEFVFKGVRNIPKNSLICEHSNVIIKYTDENKE